MNKYIVKNCPCFNEGHPMLDYCGECLSLTDDAQVCKDCTDCLLKQIVEKCKDKIRVYEYYDKDYALGQVKCAKAILRLLDIEEVK